MPNGEAAKFGPGWTIETYAVYVAALQAATREFAEERDRRYAEVNVEKEKALKIKETADLAALQLAREIQTYKDEKANNLRSQIEQERGSYATVGDLKNAIDKFELAIKPLSDYVSGAQGHDRGVSISWSVVMTIASVAVAAGYFIHSLIRP